MLLVEQTFMYMNVCTCIYLIVIRLGGWEALLFAFMVQMGLGLLAHPMRVLVLESA